MYSLSKCWSELPPTSPAGDSQGRWATQGLEGKAPNAGRGAFFALLAQLSVQYEHDLASALSGEMAYTFTQLQDEIARVADENRILRDKVTQLADENRSLRESIALGGNRPSKLRSVGLAAIHGSPVRPPANSLPVLLPHALVSMPAQRAGSLTVCVLAAHDLGSQPPASPPMAAVTMHIGQEQEEQARVKAARASYNPVFDEKSIELIVATLEDRLLLKVVDVDKEASGARDCSLGTLDVDLRSLRPLVLQKRRERLVDGRGAELEYKVCWSPDMDDATSEESSEVEVVPDVTALDQSQRTGKQSRRKRNCNNIHDPWAMRKIYNQRKSYIESEVLENNVSRMRCMYKMFGFSEADKDPRITTDLLYGVLLKRDEQDAMEREAVEAVMKELNKLYCTSRSDGSISFHNFANLMADNDLVYKVSEEMRKNVGYVQTVLHSSKVKGVAAKVTCWNSTSGKTLRSSETDLAKANEKKQDKFLNILHILVVLAVLTDVVTFAVSLDYAPDFVGWKVVEIACCVVFVGEVAIKSYTWGCAAYFCGPDKVWNWSDVAITVLTVVDVGLSTISKVRELGGAKFAVVLRCIRLLRQARLLRTSKMPGIRELANMLFAFVLGLPYLLCVTFLIGGMCLIFGSSVRQMVGPEPGEVIDLLDVCGGDSDDPRDSAECVPHKLYGVEYFDTVPKSMFTVFRCIIGDCSTRAGKSLVAEFSSAYGTKFDMLYVFGMVVTTFGIFNIITAIFLENTLQGLKYSHVSKAYNTRFVSKKLEALVHYIETWAARRRELRGEAALPKGTPVILKELDFYDVMSEKVVSDILEDLDIKLFSMAGLFELFDQDDRQEVSMPNLLSTLMKLQGDLQKSDIISCWLVAKNLQERLENLECTVSKSLQDRLDSLECIMKEQVGRVDSLECSEQVELWP